jgi:hypothetical protein
MATIWYMTNQVTGFAALVDERFNLKSPSRSTVPLLAYWSTLDGRLAEFCDALELTVPSDPSLIFEYTVVPSRGKGKASHTDLMILSSALAVAVEAKFTEPRYPTVAKWLGTPPVQNRKRVLEGWLDTINRATGGQLMPEQVRTVTYQLIHRTASACTPPAENRVVVYHCFDLVDEYRSYYSEQLARLANLIAKHELLAFYLCESSLSKTAAYAELQVRWRANTSRNFADAVRQLLKTQSIATFSTPVVSRF